MALGDISGQDGRLAVVPKSHNLLGYEKPRTADLLPGGYSKEVEKESVWHTPSHIGMGDIILFNMKTVHAASRNDGGKFRLSLDTRVTTCMGAKYLEDNNLQSLDQYAAVHSTSTIKGKDAAVSSAASDALDGDAGQRTVHLSGLAAVPGATHIPLDAALPSSAGSRLQPIHL